MKTYIKTKQLASFLPVGATYHKYKLPNQLLGLAKESLDYFACDDIPADFFMMNGDCPSQYTIEEQAKLFSGTPMPVLLTSDFECTDPEEYGLALYERRISDVLSGGIFRRYVGK